MRYNPDHRGMARLLMSRDMANPSEDAARRALQFAISISPEKTGHYKSSFQIEHQIEDGRQTIIISNTSDYASWVEWGGKGYEGMHVLARTADFIEADAVSWKRRSSLRGRAKPTNERLERAHRRYMSERGFTDHSISAPRVSNFSIGKGGKKYYSKRGSNGRFTKQ